MKKNLKTLALTPALSPEERVSARGDARPTTPTARSGVTRPTWNEQDSGRSATRST